MNFKDYVSSDVTNTFFNQDEFDDTVVIDGESVNVLIDDDYLKMRAEKEYGGITTGMILYFIPVSAYGAKKPKVGNEQIFNNKLMWIESVNETFGVYEIILNQHRGE